MTVPQIDVEGRRLDVVRWGAPTPSIVFVHDGLGSIGQWRRIPERAAVASGLGVLAFNRSGHGRSLPIPTGAWPPDWISTEAEVLARLIEQHCEGAVRLVGHSDGGSIALVCAARRPDLVTDVVAIASHTWVEDECLSAISALRRDSERLVASLGMYHAAPAALFEAWSGGWTRPEFAGWDIRPELAEMPMPVTLVQGDRDEFATEEMLFGSAAAIGTSAKAVLLRDCGHIVHRDAPDVVVDLAAARWN